MPRGNGTGPAGLGPMTGRGMGYCAGYPTPGFTNPIPGRGYFGWGRGRGRGFGRGWGPYPYFNPYLTTPYQGMGYGYPYSETGYATPYGAGFPAGQVPPGQIPTGQIPPEQELQMLKDNAQALKQEMDQINQRIAELTKESNTK